MSLWANAPDIMEVTLRDGSYLIDFQFTAEDTATIAAALEAVGFRWIEVGHGVGLHASQAGKGAAAASDEEYMEAAAQALSQARWGMFCIPGIAQPDDLRLARRYGMSFVRVGTNITEVEQAEPLINLAKELGFVVSYNAMKSYAVSPDEWGRCAARVQQWGADLVCLVDSAGGMLPDDVAAYLEAAQAQCDVPLGFHGHQNLSLAVANTLRAIDCGAVLVDASLQGMGRSAGNAITEALVAILKRRGQLAHIDLKLVMDIGQGLLLPVMQQRGMDPLAVTAGFAQFHSSFGPKVLKYAERHQVDVRDLIMRLCEADRVDAPDDLLERLGRELADERAARVVSVPAFAQPGPLERRGPAALGALLKELRPTSVKAGKASALNVLIADQPQADFVVSGNIHTTASHVVGSLTVADAAQLRTALATADGQIEVVLLDIDGVLMDHQPVARLASEVLQRSRLLTYHDQRVWIEAVEDQLVRLLGEDLEGARIAIMGSHRKSQLLALWLAQRGARVQLIAGPGEPTGAQATALMQAVGPATGEFRALSDETAPADVAACLREARAVVVWPAAGPWFAAAHLRGVSPGVHILDAGIGSLLPSAITEARARGAVLIRVDMWPALSGALLAAHESARVREDRLGWESLAGVPVVSGGALGNAGDVVVDNVWEPTRVIGVADGRGGVTFSVDREHAERVRVVSEEITRRLIRPRAPAQI